MSILLLYTDSQEGDSIERRKVSRAQLTVPRQGDLFSFLFFPSACLRLLSFSLFSLTHLLLTLLIILSFSHSSTCISIHMPVKEKVQHSLSLRTFIVTVSESERDVRYSTFFRTLLLSSNSRDGQAISSYFLFPIVSFYSCFSPLMAFLSSCTFLFSFSHLRCTIYSLTDGHL